ncbi:hypothetical protein [Ornithinimicrobium cavernae]|uniref:hypothetical protein n=1 Tax=Ornithinimicrobium cavernae TaxID=2666047 RepID=UPI00137957FE|nr:hypothetical protein [Ornithinimicrobium cavernae]
MSTESKMLAAALRGLDPFGRFGLGTDKPDVPAFDPGSVQRYAERVMDVPEVAGILAAFGAVSYDGASHDASILLHAFAGPGKLVRDSALSSHPISRTASPALGVWGSREALVGLHAEVAPATPVGDAERVSPWVNGGVWAVCPASDGTDPRVDAALRLAGTSGELRATPQGWVTGTDPIAPVLGWLLWRRRTLLRGAGCIWPNKAWFTGPVRGGVPLAQLPGRDYQDVAGALEAAGKR